MKRLLFLLFSMVAFAMQGGAQVDLRVATPPYSKFVRVSDGVNLRQGPGTQYARLAWMTEEDCAWCTHQAATTQYVTYTFLVPGEGLQNFTYKF